jgi:squalene-associated FAD-dependent desaturase
MRPWAVVGGGWAGLAAAVELADRGLPVTLFEAAPGLGGRARSVTYRGRRCDNGQHLFIGAYRALLGLLERIGVPEAAAFERRRLRLDLLSPGRAPIRLALPALPAPLHLAAGILGASGLGGGDRRRALSFCLSQAAGGEGGDRSVLSLLRAGGQSAELTERLWGPLCLATLNTPAAEASATLFLRVLRDAFLRRRRDSDLLIPRVGLEALWPAPARHYLESRGATVAPGTRVAGIEAEGGRVTGVALGNGTVLAVEGVVLAVPPDAMRRLLEPMPAMAETARRLGSLETAPICTAYLRYPSSARLDFPLAGLHGTLSQWVCDLATAGHAGLMSVVISGRGPHLEMDNAALLARVAAELRALFPAWPAPLDGWVIREKRATLHCAVGVDAHRPAARTPLPNCFLAGDGTATAYPSTLEGAVRSGLAAARLAAAAAERR